MTEDLPAIKAHWRKEGITFDKTLHKIALPVNMMLAEFFDFDELNDYSFDGDSDDE